MSSIHRLPDRTISPLREPHHFLQSQKSPLRHAAGLPSAAQPLSIVSAPNSKKYFVQEKPKKQKRPLGSGHKKCYYEELPSRVKSSIADLMLTVAEEEQRIERQR